MRTWKWMITASLLVTLGAMAQQTTPPSSSPQPEVQSEPQGSKPSPAGSQITNPPSTPQPTTTSTAPTTMDQVVDRAIEREHALIEMLQTRTPLVETYLQNLKLDQHMGHSPREDHYFFGRLDVSDSVDRRDYLSGGAGFPARLMGGCTKVVQFEYEPTGISGMLF